MPKLQLHVPHAITKELKLVQADRRSLTISSNFLAMMGFPEGQRYIRRVLSPATGFELRASRYGDVKTYERVYNHRRNNPTETYIQERNQAFLDAAIPRYCERVHLTLRNGVIIGRPVAPQCFHIRKAIRDRNTPLEVMAALSSGVDAFCLKKTGFGMQALVEFRPNERRDTRNLSETGVVTALANNPFRFVFNEDIYRLDLDRVRETLAGQPPVGLLVASPQCDDFALVKGAQMKARQLAEDPESSTADMHYEVLRLIETVEPAVVWIENVAPWLTSAAGELVLLKLRRWGYHVSADVYDARDYGGATSRRRAYVIASVFPGFTPPPPTPRAGEGTIWALIEDQIPHCRDVTHTKSLQDGLTTGRARLITTSSAHAPTILKSQPRQAKDSVFIHTPDNRYLFPNETVLRRLTGLPDEFSFDGVSTEIASEQIGQSVCFKMHHAFAEAIREHLMLQRGETIARSEVHVPISRPSAAPEALVSATSGMQAMLEL